MVRLVFCDTISHVHLFVRGEPGVINRVQVPHLVLQEQDIDIGVFPMQSRYGSEILQRGDGSKPLHQP